MKVWVVIPAYNEEKSLKEILPKLKEKDLSSIVVDDGSRDATCKVAGDGANILIRNEKNLGKGMALRRALTFLLENEKFDYVITMDADGQHSVLDIDKFIREAENGENFVVGNRMANPRVMPWTRVVTNKLMSWLISKMVSQTIPDTQCGFRLIGRDVLEKIKFRTNKFEVESEILIKAAKDGVVIKSIPIKSIYFRRIKSKIHPFLDTFRFIRFLFTINDKEK